ncbi:MAG TPA: family 1 encapsulin nanocompartment shell protein [Acidimicrobiales bacterium]
MTDHLRRAHAPVTDQAWAQIDAEAARTLRHVLAARALVDFEGPKGWEYSAHSCGKVADLGAGPQEGVSAAARQVLPLVELRTPFTMSLAELDTIDRGNQAAELDAVTDAANRAGLAEDRTVFHGFAGGGITGIAEAGGYDAVSLSEDYSRYPSSVAKAVAMLRMAGIGGPYGIALGPRCYTGVVETTEHGGYPLLEHIKLILGGPVVWAPGVDGAVVLSMRGGDFALIVGEDFSVGYAGSDGDTVELFLEESMTFEVREPRAAVALRYAS